MFIIFNKQKIYSYLISVSTVVVLFVIAFTVTTNESLITSSQVNEINDKISITVENNWNEENIENILQMLESTNKKANFYITQKLADKFQESIIKIKQYGHEITINLENSE